MNHIDIVGRLGRDPEVVQTTSGTPLTKFSVATTDGWGDREKTNWHRVVTFGKTAENCAKYLEKGRQVAVSGRVDYDSYEKDGIKRYTTDIIADSVEFLGSQRDVQNDDALPPPEGEDDDLPF